VVKPKRGQRGFNPRKGSETIIASTDIFTFEVGQRGFNPRKGSETQTCQVSENLTGLCFSASLQCAGDSPYLTAEYAEAAERYKKAFSAPFVKCRP